MAVVSELELPFFDHTDPTLRGERYREAMAALEGHDGWLAQCPFGFMVLDREAGEFFLRTKEAVFPGLTIAAAVRRSPTGPLHEEIVKQHHQRQRRRPPPPAQPRQPGAGAARGRPLPAGDARVPRRSCSTRSPADGRCEFIEAFAKPYPSLVIAEVMGAPLERRAEAAPLVELDPAPVRRQQPDDRARSGSSRRWTSSTPTRTR